MASDTEVQLLALYRTPAIPLHDICERYFSLKPRNADRRARLNQLPVPAFKLNSQKSPYMVHIKDLAAHIDNTHDGATKVWRKSQL